MIFNFFLISVIFLFSNLCFGNSLEKRVNLAIKNCLPQNIAAAKFVVPSQEEKKYFTPSRIQRILSPSFQMIFDHGGRYIQGAIFQGEMPYVNANLKYLGEILKNYSLSLEKKICLASCFSHHLMNANPQANPYLSSELAITIGDGLCRHFTYSTRAILKNANINHIKEEVALEHIFLKFNKKRETIYFDTANVNGIESCEFMKARFIHR